MSAQPTRTIVFSDAHGEPGLIRAILVHAGHDPAHDRLLFAGDAIGVGRDALGCLQLLEGLGVGFLVGNHEYAALMGWSLEAERDEPAVVRWVRQRIRDGRWQLAAAVDGVLVTHAGVSERYRRDFEVTGQGGVESFADVLNERFADAVSGGRDDGGVTDDDGPLWYRASRIDMPLSGLTQVAGHTPIEIFRDDALPTELGRAGIVLIDPFVRGWRRRGFGEPVPVRYAVIEGGEVTFVDASQRTAGV